MNTLNANPNDATIAVPDADASLDGEDTCCQADGLPVPATTTHLAPLANRLKAMADETRLRVLDLLIQHGEPLCVCEITEQFDLSQPTISHHLRLLREAALIHGEKRGTWMYYSATDKGRHSMSLILGLV